MTTQIYAPWCGHCQTLEPIYKKLAKRLRGIESLSIVKMDGTANDHPRAKVYIVLHLTLQGKSLDMALTMHWHKFSIISLVIVVSHDDYQDPSLEVRRGYITIHTGLWLLIVCAARWIPNYSLLPCWKEKLWTCKSLTYPFYGLSVMFSTSMWTFAYCMRPETVMGHFTISYNYWKVESMAFWSREETCKRLYISTKESSNLVMRWDDFFLNVFVVLDSMITWSMIATLGGTLHFRP